MDIQDIVVGLNTHFSKISKDKLGRFVLHKLVTNNSIVPSIMTYKYTLWYISKEVSTIAFNIDFSAREVYDYERDNNSSEICSLLITTLLGYMQTKNYKELCNDTNE